MSKLGRTKRLASMAQAALLLSIASFGLQADSRFGDGQGGAIGGSGTFGGGSVTVHHDELDALRQYYTAELERLEEGLPSPF